MSLLTSNIGGVIARFERFQRRLPTVLERAFEAAWWQRQCALTAGVTLKLLASTPGEKEMVPVFKAAILFQSFGPRGFAVSLTPPPGRLGAPDGGQFLSEVVERREENTTLVYPEGTTRRSGGETVDFSGRKGARRAPLAMTSSDEKRFNFAWDAVEEWVEKFKDWSPEESGMTVQEVADRIRHILFSPARTEAMERATRSLLGLDKPASDNAAGPNLGEFVSMLLASPARKGEEIAGISIETARAWLAAVQAAWVQLIRHHAPLRIREAVREQWDLSGKELAA